MFLGWTEDGRRVITSQPLPSQPRAAVRRAPPPMSAKWVALQVALLAVSGFGIGYALQIIAP